MFFHSISLYGCTYSMHSYTSRTRTHTLHPPLPNAEKPLIPGMYRYMYIHRIPDTQCHSYNGRSAGVRSGTVATIKVQSVSNLHGPSTSRVLLPRARAVYDKLPQDDVSITTRDVHKHRYIRSIPATTTTTTTTGTTTTTVYRSMYE